MFSASWPFSVARISTKYFISGLTATSARSPTRRPSSAFPTGDSLLMSPFRASCRRVVTICRVISCFASSLKMVTLSNRPTRSPWSRTSMTFAVRIIRSR